MIVPPNFLSGEALYSSIPDSLNVLPCLGYMNMLD